MEPARTIGKIGFRRWYERRLIEAHCWLVTCLLCALAIAVSAEGASFRKPLAEVLPTLGLIFVGGLICVHALRRFFAQLQEANRLAEDSTCRLCGTYDRFRVIEEFPRRMRVRCRRCDNEWMLG